MTSTDLDRVLTSVDTGIRESANERAAATYIRENLREIVENLRQSESTTFESNGRRYEVRRDQLRRALR